MFDDYIESIDAIEFPELIHKTPLSKMLRFSRCINNTVLLKREDTQPIFSFKVRGAFYKISQLSDEEKQRGIITVSAGNHAQGVAVSARHAGIKATIVMPLTTPQIKVDSVHALGGKVLLWGDTYQEAFEHMKKIAIERNLLFIPPFDDTHIITGQGTIGKEICEQFKGCINAAFIPVGGGGLCAGTSIYLKHKCPDIKIIAVESEDSACLQAALKAGMPTTIPIEGNFADGTAVHQIGNANFDILQHTVDEVITVSNNEICSAIKNIYDDTRSIVEPSGALALAGLKKYIVDKQLQGMNLVAVISGANMNFERLRYISEQVNIGGKTEALFAAFIPEKPGSFKKFCNEIGRRDITEFNYRYTNDQQAVVYTGIKTQGSHCKSEILESLNKKNIKTFDLTDNETATLHIRHMIGGNSKVDNEQLYRFEFPERIGALSKFLSHLGTRWNISLFHYRNHGTAEGRVLVGLQIPDFETLEAERLFKDLNMKFECVNHNKAVELFLKGRELT